MVDSQSLPGRPQGTRARNMRSQNVRPQTGQQRTVDRTERWLQLSFALVSCLGGIALASGADTQFIPAIAVFFAAVGFVCVDWLKLFALPPVGAYIAMGVAAVYCVSDFWDAHTTGDEQMVAVALLLVLVQAILMLQRKTPRVFEQLAVFCLLQLVVGAVFNDALQYGLLLVPFGLIGAWALSLMSSVSASEGIETRVLHGSRLSHATDGDPLRDIEETETTDLWQRVRSHWLFRPIGGNSPRGSRNIHAWSNDSILSLATATRRLQRYTLFALAPAVVLVTAIFFYALPRTTDAARMQHRGKSLVGFQDKVRLNDFGRMLQDNSTALRVKLTNRRTGNAYAVQNGLYLRGQVLEIYRPPSNEVDPETESASWEAIQLSAISGNQLLPMEHIPVRSSDRNFFDSVSVEVNCASLRTRSLFAIAPYHREGRLDQMVHAADRWTIARKDDHLASYPATEYRFGTNAFFKGQQSELITRASAFGRLMSRSLAESERRNRELGGLGNPTDLNQRGDQNIHDIRSGDQRNQDGFDRSAFIRGQQYPDGSYLATVTKFDAESMPKLAQLAQDIMASIPPKGRTTVSIARAFERHLAIAGGYQYSLKLDGNADPGVDPIEYFVSQSRTGHCQYFASALTMMLRSVNIPARVVVGFRTDEFNDLGQYYTARQLHAHAWVETLVDVSQLDPNRAIYGQANSNEYWLRLDPTPGEQRAQSAQVGSVDEVLNMAENLWEKYVVGMDADRQSESMGTSDRTWIESMAGWIQENIDRIRSGRLGRGALAGRELFSWRAALWGGILAITVFVLLRLPFPSWIRRQITRKSKLAADKPAVPFYAETLSLLSRIGINRQPQQTPRELYSLTMALEHELAITGLSEPLAVLTSAFCDQRYGSSGKVATPNEPSNAEVSTALQRLRDRVDEVAADRSLMNRLAIS